MKVYTKTGDKGETSIIGGRVPKDDPRIEAYGTIDELNSFTGQAVFLAQEAGFEELREQLLQIQHELFDCGSDLAYAKHSEDKYKVSGPLVERLEEWMDQFELENPPLERFILPGGSALSSALHGILTVADCLRRLWMIRSIKSWFRIWTLSSRKNIPIISVLILRMKRRLSKQTRFFTN